MSFFFCTFAANFQCVTHICVDNVIICKSMITISSKIKAKVKDFEEHCEAAFSFMVESKFEDALERFRKSAEAFVKIYVYNQCGDELGDDLICGRKRADGSVIANPESLRLSELLRLVNTFPSNAYQRLKDVQRKGNPSSHDSNDPKIKEQQQLSAMLCLAQTRELAVSLYNDLSMPLPVLFTEVDKIQGAGTVPVVTDDWYKLQDAAMEWDSRLKYILVFPASYGKCDYNSLSALSRMRWSTIIDFNPKSRESGLYKAFEPDVDKYAIPLMITQLPKTGMASNAEYGSTNWIFANGVQTVPNTITSDFKGWKNAKYPFLIEKIFSESTSVSLNRLFVLFVDTEEKYFREILSKLENLHQVEANMITVAYCSADGNKRHEAESVLDDYLFESYVFNVSVTDLVSGMMTRFEEENVSSVSVMMPGRNAENAVEWIDCSVDYTRCMDAGIQLVHRHIAEKYTIDDDTPAFYNGEQISWVELSASIDVSRAKYKDVEIQLRGLLENAKQSRRFDLYHRPGAGGSTLSRRLAYNLREEYPVLILHNYTSVTAEKLVEVIFKLNRPVLVVTEASMVKMNHIEELLTKCNSKKRIAIFLVVQRGATRKKSGTPMTAVLSEKIADFEEQNRFLGVAKRYCKNKDVLKELTERPLGEKEVIDFSLAFSNNNYSKKKLVNYVGQYIAQLPEDIIDFLVTVSLVYYYSQCSVSHLLYRKNFKQDFEKYLRTDPDFIISKLLVRETYDGQITDNWRPRYSLFADAILQYVLGHGKVGDGWKDQIPLYAKQMIAAFKQNDEYLTEDTKKILAGVFLDRGNEDVLGVDTDWQSASYNDQFSMLLKDIGDNPSEQKNILMELANAYPNEPHYWAHLGRYVYEKGSCPEAYDEALGYIRRAFESGGDVDGNIQHIAGMCMRRKLEFYFREKVALTKDEIINLTNESKRYFDESMRLTPGNMYAYISEIQLLSCAIEFGRQTSKFDEIRHFLLSQENKWFLQQYETINELMDDANVILKQMEHLGITKRLMQAKAMLGQKESRIKAYMGDYKASLEIIQRMIAGADREERPRLRLIYVRSLLLSKVNGDKTRTQEAWTKLSNVEEDTISEYLTNNIKQDASDSISIRLWFDLVRYSSLNISDEEIISRLTIMYSNSDERSIAKGQAAYFLMILKSVQMLKQGYSTTSSLMDEIKKYREDSKRNSTYDKYPYEWLLDLNGIQGIVSDRLRKDNKDLKLYEMSGTITDIQNRQQGTITLNCGLDVFFVPALGEFTRDHDVAKEVYFVIGFRHDGLAAYEVKREKDASVENQANDGDEDVPEVVEDIPEEMIEEPLPLQSEEGYPILQTPKLAGPKIVGRIDLSQFNRRK